LQEFSELAVVHPVSKTAAKNEDEGTERHRSIMNALLASDAMSLWCLLF